MRIEVSAPARLHLGDLDPFALGRFGYAPILAIDMPRTVVEAEEAETLIVRGLEAEEARVYAQRIIEAKNLKGAKLDSKEHSSTSLGVWFNDAAMPRCWKSNHQGTWPRLASSRAGQGAQAHINWRNAHIPTRRIRRRRRLPSQTKRESAPPR